MVNGELPLPGRPERLKGASVAVWSQPVVLPTYLPEPPDRFPAYLDRRVYQGSSGKVFPLPFHDRISESRTDHEWVGLHLENEYLRLLVLPELGGRIQYAIDRRTGYSLFYANPVIKPALVGLAGPWLAGGVEFNWPQHHRPGTFLPVAWELDEANGTVWCSDHDPFARMKGMHGVRLRPGSTLIEVDVRLFNRSDESQTFLWWANVAAEVHDDYQSFFPADVTMVADHAKRAVTGFPAADRPYYGVDYPARHTSDHHPGSSRRVPGDRLDWPRNIPVPTSYMCVGSTGDFFGGYDFRANAGFVHWADHHFVVGKKQWTWGNAPFGQVWNRNLVDDDSAYIELMAGAFTENQPDFSHLAPGETKRFVQCWYPLAGTGPVVAATRLLALGVEAGAASTRFHLDATEDLGTVELVVRAGNGQDVRTSTFDLGPRCPITAEFEIVDPVSVVVIGATGTLLEWSTPSEPVKADVQPAREPDSPADVAGVEELYLIGRHLEQYRHATRSPEPYWNEAIARDPGHSASHVALARRRYGEARYQDAERHARTAIARLTRLNPNPETGDAHYLLGLSLVRLGQEDEAYDAFAKASWIDSWVAPARLQMALIDARRGADARAVEHLDTALRARPEHLQARNLLVVVLRRLGRNDEATATLDRTMALDRVDAWARHLAGALAPQRGQQEAEVLLDVALEYARAGETNTALALCDLAGDADSRRPLGQTSCGVLSDYIAAWIMERCGDHTGAAARRERARDGDRTWNFASRLDDVDALQAAVAADNSDPTAAALLGHWCYAHGRHSDAIQLWRRSVDIDPTDPVVWRNLGVAAYNVERNAEAAMDAYDHALALAPADARLLFESDQLHRRVGTPLAMRLAVLDQHPELVGCRDDLTVEHANLLVSAGRPDAALGLLAGRRFQPWEGGEGQALRAWERTRLALADACLAAADPASARTHLEAALEPPASLGETRHPLASPAQLLLAIGDAAAAAADLDEARDAWARAAAATGDFTRMAPTDYSENTYFSILAAERLGDAERAAGLRDGLCAHVDQLSATPARIDYFATSLPTLLLFDEDPQRQQDLTESIIRAQLAILADDRAAARRHLAAVVDTDPANELALDLLKSLNTERYFA